MPRRGENIYKRKDGRWEGRYIKCYNKNNKAVYGSVYAHSYSEVKLKLSHAKSEVQNQSSAIKQNGETLEDYSLQWLKKVQAQVKPSTFVKYTNVVNNHIVPGLGFLKVTELSTEIVREFTDKLLLSGNMQNHKGLSAKSVKDIVSVLHLILRYTGDMGTEASCNFDLISIKSNQIRKETISERENKTLVKYLLTETDNIKLGILICLYTGLRIGEICAMRFEDISLEDNIIYVNKTMQRLQTLNNNSEAKTAIIISAPKSISSYRAIPIPDFLAKLVEGLLNNPKAYILTGKINKYIEPRTMENKFKKCLKKCGLSDYNFHQLRHRFATHCIEVGFEIKSLSEILGHSNVNITLNRYVHSSLETKRFNMNKLQENFG